MPLALRDPELPEMLGVRLDEKTRYLLELACRQTGQSLSAYSECAIIESFNRVTLHKPSDPEPMYGSNPDDAVIPAVDEEQVRVKREAMLVSNMANIIWSDNPFTRLEIRALTLPHLLSDDDKQLWNYIHTRDEFKVKDKNGYKFDRDSIAENWQTIKEQASRPQRRKK